MATAKTPAKPEPEAPAPTEEAPAVDKIEPNPVEATEPYPTGAASQPTYEEINGLPPKKEA